jgi:SPP1 gp7 family putative phage head morphogenesis protein
VANLAAGDFDIRFRRIPGTIEANFLDGVWNQTILPQRLDAAMWSEHFTRLRNHAEAGWGRRFSQAQSVQEWERFQRLEANLRDFAAHKQHRMIEELRALKASGLTRADWDKDAAKVLARQNSRWLRAELQAATAAAQAAESWAEFERRADLYPNLKYQTAGDERVRESHRVLDNIVRPVNDPFWDVYYPPNGWSCRCTVVQTDEAATEPRDPGFTPPKGFRHNPGKSGQVFGDDHPYFDVARMDREAIEEQGKAFHAATTRNEVRTWSKTDLVPTYRQQLPEMPQVATITNSEVKTVTGKPHAEAASRNALMYILPLLGREELKFVGSATDDQSRPGVVRWYYYLLEALGNKYYFNFWERADEDGTRIGLHAINDVSDGGRGP